MAISASGLHGQHKTSEKFVSKKTTKTASFIVNETIVDVFPLFGAFEERKWDPHWEPILIYPDKEIIEEGTAFKIKGKGHGHGSESEYLWIVTKFSPQTHLIQYLVSTPNRFWTITVKCRSIENDAKTNATVTYSFTGLTAWGNKLNQENIGKMYQDNLQDWADALNKYFRNK